MSSPRIILTAVLFLLGPSPTAFSSPSHFIGFQEDDKARTMLESADGLHLTGHYDEAIVLYQKLLQNAEVDSALVLRKMAICYAAFEDPTKSTEYIEKYLFEEFEPPILYDRGFDPIRNTPEFQGLVNRYLPKLNMLTLLYLYVALIGFYIAAMIFFNKKLEGGARTLIGAFIFIHSVFILHFFVHAANYHYKYPHSYATSTGFSFLYGPLLYFYFKRITQGYKFRYRDLLHLIPTLLFFFYAAPIYMLSGEEKLQLLLDRFDTGRSLFDIVIIVFKLLSLIIYGYFIGRVYAKAKKSANLTLENRVWQRNLFVIHIMFVSCYAVYGAFLANNITYGPTYHLPVISMALMVMYIGYSANIQPNVFCGLYTYGNQLFLKYEKSGLTQSLSKELRENLIRLFDIEKIYKENDISLEMIAERLNTTRHNASQVINEHFDMSFHELVNSYRIHEAKDILNNDSKKNLNIIDVAYEVGYNNKVTFNKAFKKNTNLTPSEYQKMSVRTEL